MANKFLELLATNAHVVADGGMGTMLFASGLQRGASPELLNVEQPGIVRRIHAGYIEAGAQIILTNTFGGSRLRLAGHKLADRAAELNQAAAAVALEAASAADHPVVVAGSIGPSGALLEPYGDLAFDDAVAAFAEQAGALARGGVDVLWIETMADLEEVRAAVEACRNAAPDLPIVATMTFDTGGRTMMGVTPERALTTLKGLGATAIGANCGKGPEEIEGVIAQMHAADPTAVLVAKANAGIPHMVNGEAVYDATPAVMGVYADHVRELGARIIGACCGSTPAHVRAIADALTSA